MSKQPSRSSKPGNHAPYELRISRLTVDKLGVKLYDKVSAAVAELVANSYDADAEQVTIKLPLSTLLTKGDGSPTADAVSVIEVVDDGHGMTPEEGIDYYLKVGRDRRRSTPNGGYSRTKKRPVMGRKGIGKLAPFGICQRMEVISSGGKRTKSGFLTAHFFLDYEELLKDEETAVPIVPGNLDGTYQSQSGTIVRLSQFLPKRVPDAETFHRQLATRFVFAQPDFKITVTDTRDPTKNPPRDVSPVNVAVVNNTRIDLSSRPLTTEGGEELQVTGWLAMAQDAYRNEETAGVRIYARNKLVAMTRDFEQPAGFTGEFTIRSYLVGQVFAEWLDVDDGEDLIRSDRQGILWESDYGRALRSWGSSLIKEIGKLSKEPRRTRVRDVFLAKSKVEARARDRFADAEVADAAIEIAKQIGGFAAEDELQDSEYVEGLTEFILNVAPHKALIEAFQRFSKEVAGGEEPTLDNLLDLFGKTRVAEMASYSQIAAERVRAIQELEGIVLSNATEDKLQDLITRAPWLVEASWTVLTKNQALKTFKTEFEDFYEQRTGKKVTLAIGLEKKRPDFTLVSLGHRLHVVEIKKPKYSFGDADAGRLVNYLDVFDKFFEDHETIREEFPQGYEILLIVDSIKLNKPANRRSIEAAIKEKKVSHVKWKDFLNRAKKSHEQFLDASDRAAKRVKLKKT
ncbi:MAG: ATP-binding protein [Pirellulales bacterium]